MGDATDNPNVVSMVALARMRFAVRDWECQQRGIPFGRNWRENQSRRQVTHITYLPSLMLTQRQMVVKMSGDCALGVQANNGCWEVRYLLAGKDGSLQTSSEPQAVR